MTDPNGSSSKSHISTIEWDMMDKTKFLPLSMLSSFCVRCSLYPLTLIKTRLQIQKHGELYKGNVIGKIFAVKYSSLLRLSFLTIWWIGHPSRKLSFDTIFHNILVLIIYSCSFKLQNSTLVFLLCINFFQLDFHSQPMVSWHPILFASQTLGRPAQMPSKTGIALGYPQFRCYTLYFFSVC